MSLAAASPTARIARLIGALPDALTGCACLVVWVAPLALGQGAVKTVVLMMLMEFLLVHGTGFFTDVKIETENNVVVVVVQERPTIASINFSGMREFDSKAIITSLAQVGFAEGRIFDRSMLERAEYELKQQYLSKGKYGVEVTATVTPLPRNRVGVSFDVFEGSVARIQEIRFVGNKAFSEGDLLDVFQLTTPGWLTWYTDTDKYSREKLEGDLERLRSFYLDQGYLEFSVEPPQVTIFQCSHDQQHGVRSQRHRFEQLVVIDDEVLAEHGDRDCVPNRTQVLRRTVEERGLGQDRDRGRTGGLVRPCMRGGVVVLPENASRGGAALALGDDARRG